MAKPNVALFVSCLVDVFRPSVGFATLKLLEAADWRPAVPLAQTCCGQPAYNSGNLHAARKVARVILESCGGVDLVVSPCGWGGGRRRHNLSSLF